MNLLDAQPSKAAPAPHVAHEIRMITTAEEFEAVARLRYEVFVVELGLDVPGADHERRIVVDGTDQGGPVLGAFAADGQLVMVYGVYRTI